MGHQDKAHATETSCLVSSRSAAQSLIFLLMPGLSRFRSLVIVLDKHLDHLSVVKMKIRKATELLEKAVTSFKSKAGALRTKLIILASLRRRMALVGAVSRRFHSLVSLDGRAKQAWVDYYDRALMRRQGMAAVSEDNETVLDPGHGGMVVDLSEMAMFDEDAHGFPDWTQSLFDDDNFYVVDEDVEDDDDDFVLDALDEPSVIEVIRSNREVQGLEFNMDEEIDEACDMFIRRFRSRMNRSF